MISFLIGSNISLVWKLLYNGLLHGHVAFALYCSIHADQYPCIHTKQSILGSAGSASTLDVVRISMNVQQDICMRSH